MTAAELGITDPLYTVKQTCKLLKTSPTGVYGMVHSGKLRLIKLGPKKSRIIGPDIVTVLNKLLESAAA
jgi:excisionase family DNA binding protein